MHNILVTGGAGYIGGQTVLALLDQGFEVTVVDDLSTGSIKDFHKYTCFVEGDFGDSALISRICQDRNISAIMHFAAFIDVGESVCNPMKYWDNNLIKIQGLLAPLARYSIDKFIFSSTAAVYGEPADAAVSENTRTHPVNPYGASKLDAETMIKDVAEQFDFRAGILRYFNVAGADLSLRNGQRVKKPKHLIGRALAAALGVMPPLQVFGHDYKTCDGTGVRDYIHVCDVAAAHIQLLRYLDHHAQGLFNIGYGHGFSVMQVIKSVEKVCGIKVPFEIVGRRPGDPACVIADNRAIRHHMGWVPAYDNLDLIIETSYNYMKNMEKI